MDAYVSKPIRAQELFDVLRGLLASAVAGPPESEPTESSGPRSEEPAFDLDATLARCDGDWELLGDMVQLFLPQSEALLAQIGAAVESGDAPALEKAAHKLKGSIGNFSAPRAFAAAQSLEELGRRRELDGCRPVCEELEQALARLQTALSSLETETQR
jgi:HPt (histidine-containing phosphotransfer) domain-containing protein